MAAKSYPARNVPKVIIDEVGGIAVDTNVYRHSGFRIRSGALGQLSAVSKWSIQFLVPEIWHQETRKHLLEWTMQQLADVRRAAHDVTQWGTIDQMLASANFESTYSSETPELVADRILNEHHKVTKATILRTHWPAGSDVLDAYFAARYPFESSGEKRKEFPDAFALATLRAWAAKRSKKVIVVSGDEGCLAACDLTTELLGFKTLSLALSTLNDADVANRTQAQRFTDVLARELVDERSELRLSIEAAVGRLVDELEITADADADEDFDTQIQDVELVQVLNYRSGKAEVNVVTQTAHRVSFTWDFRMEIAVTARFAYAARRFPAAWGRPVAQSHVMDQQAFVTIETTQPISVKNLSAATVVSVEFDEKAATVEFKDADFGGDYY